MKIGIALGAGGARGLAHICFLEVLEELGVKPHVISGTSIGAIIGAAYAAGNSSKDLKDALYNIVFEKDIKFWEIHRRSDLIKVFSFIDPEIKQGGLIKGEKFINFLGEFLKIGTFEELKIPMHIIATDFFRNECVRLSTGNLLDAIRASYAIPGLFSPVVIDDQLLIDGGVSNPLPYDIIQNQCDVTVAVDVSAHKTKQFTEVPAAYEVMFAGFSMLQRSIIREKLKRTAPDIYIDTDIQNVRIHEFKKADLIFEQVQKKKDELKFKLEKLFNNLS